MPKSVKARKKRVAQKKKSILLSYPYTVLITVAALLLSLFVIVSQTQKSQDPRTRAQITNCTVLSADLTVDTEEQKMLILLNNFRKQKGAPQLKISQSLTRSASWMSQDMATTKKLDHTDSLNRSSSKRAKDCGSPYSAENIAFGNTDAQSTMDQWINSPGHNRNMGDPKYTVVGIAHSGNYWTQVFAEEDENTSPNPQEITPTTPTVNVPNPECLGSCPTQPVEQETNPSVVPDEVSQSPSQTPDEENEETPENTDATPALGQDTNDGDGNFEGRNAEGAGGIIALFLAFLKAILEAFLSL